MKKEIRDYLIKEKLGVGSYGVVFLVQKKEKSTSKVGKLNFMNAVKENVNKNKGDASNTFVLKQISLFNMSQKEIEEVNSEAELLASITSKFVVKYVESFVEDNYLYIIMEYCEGGDLSNFIKNQRGKLLQDQQIWTIFIQVCLGLYYLHNQKILHRDIKSLNIFISKNGVAKLGDLGVAKVLSTSFANTFVGTPYYLSPEMCEEKPYNQKSDVWAIGCILYELITFKHPFNAMNQGALIIKIIRGKYDPLPLNVTSDCKKMIDIILEKNYNKRPFINEILQHPIIVSKAKLYGLFNDLTDTGLSFAIASTPLDILKEKAIVGSKSFAAMNDIKVISKNPKASGGFGKNIAPKEKSKEKCVMPSNSKIESVFYMQDAQDAPVKNKSSSKIIDSSNLKAKLKNDLQSSRFKLQIPAKYSVNPQFKPRESKGGVSLVSEIMGSGYKGDLKNVPKSSESPINKHDGKPLFPENGETNVIQIHPLQQELLDMVKPKKIIKKKKKKTIDTEPNSIVNTETYFKEDDFEETAIQTVNTVDSKKDEEIFDNMLSSIKNISHLQSKKVDPTRIKNAVQSSIQPAVKNDLNDSFKVEAPTQDNFSNGNISEKSYVSNFTDDEKSEKSFVVETNNDSNEEQDVQVSNIQLNSSAFNYCKLEVVKKESGTSETIPCNSSNKNSIFEKIAELLKNDQNSIDAFLNFYKANKDNENVLEDVENFFQSSLKQHCDPKSVEPLLTFIRQFIIADILSMISES